MIKKRLVLSFVALMFILSINLVSAYSYGYGFDIRRGAEQFIDFVVDFAEPGLQVLLGGQDYTGLLLFERFLIFIMLLSVVYIALSNVPIFESNKGAIWTVAIIIPLLAVRFIDFAWLNTILMQYQVLGIAIAGILPFIIYTYFLHSVSQDSVLRKIGWIFFIVIYFGLWSTNTAEAYSQIYFWTMVVALVFLFADGTIHRIIEHQRWKESEKGPIYQRIADLEGKITKMSESGIPEYQKRKQLKRMEKEMKYLYKMAHSL